jgi:hypothetical protein
MTKHPNNMVEWAEIRCQRGCEQHISVQTHVNLGGLTPYHDLTSIPADLAVDFDMLVWNTALAPVDGGPYCPARDAVSETIAVTGVWEPRETVMALRAFVDFGAQIGWFSLLAAIHGLDVWAFEADPDCADLIAASAKLNGVFTDIDIRRGRIGPDSGALEFAWPITLVKIDLEGAENEAIRMIDPLLGANKVERLMIEVSPVFDDYYPQMVTDLMFGYGFRAFLLPPKQHPAIQITGDPNELVTNELHGSVPEIKAQVASWHQEDVSFVREDLM